ncbi:MAG: bifunctional (p)ppGpp synthetase/guanosine-3',5'-bis(diphosphate) 3'-pyrophosphohydrolase, partial [Alistipes sp.]|nr:bifunctional (p)ppGpp synthetase/guanosine-3',5'-bis(diphosphate) 3'-pyrophosphohydrolase [Alistipes sp.]
TGTELYECIASQKIEIGSTKEILLRWLSGEAEEERRQAAAEIERRKAEQSENRPQKRSTTDALVIDDAINKIEYKLAKCCNPINGDDVFGFITINSGVTIHRNDCPNAQRLRENYPYRIIEARWRSQAEGAFRASITVVAQDMPGIAIQVAEVISRELKLNMRSIAFSSRGDGTVRGTVVVEVPGTGMVDTLVHSVMKVKGVIKAFRS